MRSNIFAGMRRIFVLMLVVCLVFGAIPAAQADIIKAGAISNFRLLDADPVVGADTRYKVTIRQAGQLTAVLTDQTTGEQNTVLDQYYGSSQNILLQVPGALIKDGHSYSLDLKLVKGGSVIGSGCHTFAMIKVVSLVQSLSVTSAFEPQEGEALRATFHLPFAAQVTAHIKNAGGQTVAVVASGASYPIGSHALTWSGALAGGQLAPAGSYRFEIYCVNSAGTSPVVSASFRITGDPSEAMCARTEGTVESLVFPQQPRDGENPVFLMRTTAAGRITLKLKDCVTGKVHRMVADLNAGLNLITIESPCVGGREYILQLIHQVSGKTTGKAELNYSAHMDPPSISISAPTRLEAGYGAAYPISYTIGTSGNVILIVTDVNHTVVYYASQISGLEKGTHTAYWNGLDGAGNILPEGRYHVVAECVNSVGKVSSNVVSLNYTGAIAEFGLPGAAGAITLFAPADDPTPPELTPVRLRVQTTCAGTLKVYLNDMENNTGTHTVYNARVSAGMNTITIPADYFRSSSYRLEAKLTAGKKVVGKAVAYVDPIVVSPEIKNFSCSGKFEGELQDACRFSFETASTGSLFVRIQDLQGNTVRTIVNGAKTAAGAHAYSWNGRNDADEFVPAGSYWIFTAYIDIYGNHSNHGVQLINYQPQPLPEGVYEYVVLGKGDHRDPVHMYNKPNGQTVGVTYGVSAVFDVLEEYGEWVRVRVSGTKGGPVECYVKADRLQKVAVTSPYRIEVNIARYTPTAQSLFLYKDDVLIDQFKISTGMYKGTTPMGKFSINTRRPYFTVLGGAGICYDTLYVIGGVCIHRIPMINGSYREAEQKLGSVASHGCIRVPIEKSAWLYQNIPDTTPVIIYSK